MVNKQEDGVSQRNKVRRLDKIAIIVLVILFGSLGLMWLIVTMTEQTVLICKSGDGSAEYINMGYISSGTTEYIIKNNKIISMKINNVAVSEERLKEENTTFDLSPVVHNFNMIKTIKKTYVYYSGKCTN